VNSLPKTVTRQRRGCDLNPGHSAPESSTLTTRLPSTQFGGRHLIVQTVQDSRELSPTVVDTIRTDATQRNSTVLPRRAL